MSSPSAGKRRMDTDVIKLYPLLLPVNSAEQVKMEDRSAVLCFDLTNSLIILYCNLFACQQNYEMKLGCAYF